MTNIKLTHASQNIRFAMVYSNTNYTYNILPIPERQRELVQTEKDAFIRANMP